MRKYKICLLGSLQERIKLRMRKRKNDSEENKKHKNDYFYKKQGGGSNKKKSTIKIIHILQQYGFGCLWFIVFNATFNNISVISWRSVLLVEETGVPGEHHGHNLIRVHVITKLPNNIPKGKSKLIRNRQNQSTTGKLGKL